MTALREAIRSDPWTDDLPPWPLPPRALTAGDVGRGLLVELPHVIDELLLDDPSEYSERRFREDVERWRGVAEDPGLEIDRDLPLARPFARRWAMTLTRGSARPLTALQLLGHGVSAGMIAYLSRYSEGLVTADEAALQLRVARPAPRHISRLFARVRERPGAALPSRIRTLLRGLRLAENEFAPLLEIEAGLFANAPAERRE